MVVRHDAGVIDWLTAEYSFLLGQRLMKRKKKCQFINLAETLALQNDMVGHTMDSLLEHVSRDAGLVHRSDYEQIRKMAEQTQEFNELKCRNEAIVRSVPHPKHKLRKHGHHANQAQ